MRAKSRLPWFAVLASMLGALSGCAMHRLENVWADPAYRGPLKRVLVLATNKDTASRRIFEEIVVADLVKRGVQAVPSYEVMPEAKPTEKEVADKVREGGYDAALVTRALGQERRSTYIPGYSYAVPYVVPGPYWGTYSIWYDYVWDPGYVQEYDVIGLETTLWLTGGQGKVVWAGTVEALASDSAARKGRAVSRAVLPALEKLGIIGPER